MGIFYNIDSTRVSLREYFWWHKSPLVLIPWLMKWFRMPVSCSSDDPNTDSTVPFVVESLPPEIGDRFSPLTAQLMTLGFVDPVYHIIYDPGTRTTIYWATFQQASGNHFARIQNRVWQQAAKPNRALFPMFLTAFTDGTFFISSAGKPDMAAPATVRMNRMPGASPERLWARHQQLSEQMAARKLIVPIRTREDLIELTERHHVLVRDFHLARGVFRLRTTEQQAQADSFAATVAQGQAAGLENAEVLAELQKLQEQKPGWGATIPILILSLVAFVLLGVARWDWQFTLLIIPVLVFHECGHWVAMRVFQYRNLRMFFIPLFGAAVTGRNWNVPGWKKAVVSLAGPLPGIGVGIFLGVAGVAWHQPLLTKAALILVFINGFNLLPVLPLDGGHVLHTLLFSRNRWLDVVFRLLAVGGLVLMGIAGLSRLFIPLAAIMALALPVAFKLARITDHLRKMPLPEPAPGEDRIPVPTAQSIIAEVKAAFPKNISHKQTAQYTLSIFETLNARPPGTLGTIGLLAVHGGTFLLVIIFGLGLAVARVGGFGNLARSAAQPPHSYQCGSAQEWPGSNPALAIPQPHTLIVATFPNAGKCTAEFGRITGELSPSNRLICFGDSLLLSLPASDDAGRDKWFDRLQTATTNLFAVVSNQAVSLHLVCLAPTLPAATNLEGELEAYFNSPPGLHLVAPWSPEYATPAFADHRYARHFWQELDAAVARAGEDSAVVDRNRQIAAAERRGAQVEARRLAEDQQELISKVEEQIHERLRASATNPLEPPLIELHEVLGKTPVTNRLAQEAVLRQVAARLGEMEYLGDKPSPTADALGAMAGFVSRRGLIIDISWAQLTDATISLPALSDWLCSQKCIHLRYELSAGYAPSAAESE